MDNSKKHNLIYINENRKDEPKEYFKFIVNYSNEYLKSIESPNVLDIGCASGDFLFYIAQVHRHAKLTGLDANNDMLEIAKNKVPDAEYIYGNIDKGTNLPKCEFDAIFMSGVNYIFDDYKPYIKNIIKLLKSTGRAYVFGSYNPEEVDVMAKIKRCGENYFEPGWNIFSIRTISDFLETLSVGYKFIEWNIHLDIQKNESDPLRSWTITKSNSEKIIVNGAQFINNFYLLTISKLVNTEYF